jgi:subtilisin family serine protease
MARTVSWTVAAATVLAAAACSERAPLTAPPPPPPAPSRLAAGVVPNPSMALAPALGQSSFVIDFVDSVLPADVASQVAAAGGTLTAALNGIGVAVAVSSDPAFAGRAAKITGVSGVAPDLVVQWVQPEQVQIVEDVAEVAPPEPAASLGAFETFRPSQWAPDAISAPAAWDAGARGAGARVAIVDGGIRNTHIDIAPRLDVARSASFVPGQPYNFDQAPNAQGQCVLNDTFWHATHVAGIVAAPANNIGTVGIAPDATIIGVKVLHCGSGAFSWVISGIYYAATPITSGGAGADVINMSLGALLDRKGVGVKDLERALGKATSYAHRNGVTVVAALGNNAIDLDHSGLVVLPAMSPHVIAVSATGPLGFGLGATNFDRPASYSNFGRQEVTFAAPGGDFALPGNALCSKPRFPTGVTVFPCWVFDMVVAPCRGRGASNSTYCWAAGTSMAAPAVSGVAALVIGRFGRLPPGEVEARIRATADQPGDRTRDSFYGRGRVNAFRAVQ